MYNHTWGNNSEFYLSISASNKLSIEFLMQQILQGYFPDQDPVNQVCSTTNEQVTTVIKLHFWFASLGFQQVSFVLSILVWP